MTKFIQLGEPAPRKLECPARSLLSTDGPPIFLSKPIFDERKPFYSVLLERRTRRDAEGATEESLSAILWICGKTLSRNQCWEHRMPPSAGGLHSVRIILFNEMLWGRNLMLYSSINHSVSMIRHDKQPSLNYLIDSAESVINSARQGTLCFLVGDAEWLNGFYANPESLLWRDAGVLLAYLSLASQYSGCGSCCLGSTFHDLLFDIINSDSLLGLGGIFIGSEVKAAEVGSLR